MKLKRDAANSFSAELQQSEDRLKRELEGVKTKLGTKVQESEEMDREMMRLRESHERYDFQYRIVMPRVYPL